MTVPPMDAHARNLATPRPRLYLPSMPQLGDARIRAMFAEFGLETEEERSRFVDLARVGVVDIAGEDRCLIALVESPSTGPIDERDAELP
jgi:hypothetical protein